VSRAEAGEALKTVPKLTVVTIKVAAIIGKRMLILNVESLLE
jgi:hypothetical protein